MRLLVVLLSLLAVWSAARLVRERTGDPPVLPVAAHRVDLARASLDELGALPGVGRTLAERIASARRRAPLRDMDDLVRVPGIGPALAARILPYVRFAAGEPDH